MGLLTKEEYLERVNKNQKITGYGIDTTMHLPCPFCGAPDFTVYKVLEAQDAMKKESICSECKRGARAIFHNSHGGIEFEVVQTVGPDPDVEGIVMPRRDTTTPSTSDGENRLDWRSGL